MRVEKTQLSAIKARALAELQSDLKALDTDRDYLIVRLTPEIEDGYRMLGVLGFLHDGDLAEFFRNMYLAASVRQRFLGCVAAGLKPPPGFLAASYDSGIYEALCSGEPQVLKTLASNRASASTDVRVNNFSMFFALALRFVIIDALDDAREMIDCFDAERKGRMSGYSRVGRGLTEKDPAEFNGGLENILEARREQIAEDVDVKVAEQWLSVECVGLARLGQARGLKVEIEDPLLPRELLGKPLSRYPDAGTVLPPLPGRIVEVPEEPVPEAEEGE